MALLIFFALEFQAYDVTIPHSNISNMTNRACVKQGSYVIYQAPSPVFGTQNSAFTA